MRRNDMNDNYDRAPAALEAEVSRGLTQSGFINREVEFIHYSPAHSIEIINLKK